MTRYQDWNAALVHQFTQGIPLDSPVFLGITEGVLEEVGSRLGLAPGEARTDFISAVRSAIVINARVHLEHLRERYRDGTPQGVAFLALCVLAAYDMGKDEDLDAKNYFKGLRELLGVDAEEAGRPRGMRAGSEAEEPLWRTWNLWLEQAGFVSTAHKQAERYIGYPISQALVRHADHRSLIKVFGDSPNSFSSSLDSVALGEVLEARQSQLTRHLRGMLRDPERRVEALEAAYASFERFHSGESGPLGAGKLFAGLYRDVDRHGEVTLRLYPRQRPGGFSGEPSFEHAGTRHLLSPERPGWYTPILDLKAKHLSIGVRISLSGVTLNELVLPARSLWVLIADSFSGSSALATWGAPPLGLPFALLLHQSLSADLERARSEGLLEWEECEDLGEGWSEYTGCLVQRGIQRWEGVLLNRALREALKPRERVGLHLCGGLAVGGAYLEGHLPSFSVVGDNHAEREGSWTLRDLSGVRLEEGLLVQGQPQSLPMLRVGQYLLEVTLHGVKARRTVVVKDWSSLTPAVLKGYSPPEGELSLWTLIEGGLHTGKGEI